VVKRLQAVAVTVLVAGCTADTMRTYVGRDVREVELQYGPPSNQIDLAPGSRAFQWTKLSVDTTPVTATSVTEKTKKGGKYTTTQFTGGDRSVTRCVYTFITAWDAARTAWIVTGIRQPSLDCAIGDLS
jgi:hypothetical protein